MDYDKLIGCYAIVFTPDGSWHYASNTINLISSYRYETNNKVLLKLHPIYFNPDLQDFYWITHGLIRVLGHPDRQPLVKLLYDIKNNYS